MLSSRSRAAIELLRTPRGAWVVLGLAMALSAALILATADGETFGIDEIFYLGRLVEDSGRIVPYDSLSIEYLLAPYNGHLQLGGKLVYEAVFTVAGPSYPAFVLVNVAALCACAGLTFELARRRIGPLAALAPCVLLLFLGFAREVLLWPFDMHTLLSLAFGLAAMLALQRDDRRGDVLACVLMVLSIAMIEVGIAILAGIAVSVLIRPDRWRRVWIFILPAALYLAWWVWAHRFHQDQSAVTIDNITLIPETVFFGLSTVLGALTGTNPVIPATYVTPVTWFGRGLAVLATVALLLRLRRGAVPRTLWVWLAVLLFYWVTMAAAARPPEGSRYLFFGAVGVLLVAAEAMHGRISNRVTAGIFVIALLALPANIAQLRSGHEDDALHHDAPISRTEWAMLELAADRVDPEYVPSADPNVAAAGGGLFIGIPAGAYLDSVERHGSAAFSLDQVHEQPEEIRKVADITLADANRMELVPVGRPLATRGCRSIAPAPGENLASFPLSPGRTVLGATDGTTVNVGLRRFAGEQSGVLGTLEPGGRGAIEVFPDDAPEHWQAIVDAPVTVCATG